MSADNPISPRAAVVAIPLTGSLEVSSVQEHCEARVATQGIEEGMHFEKLHDVRSLFGGSLHPYKCLFSVTESQVGIKKRGRRDVPGFSSPVEFVEKTKRFRVRAAARLHRHARASPSTAELRSGKGSGALQSCDSFIETFGPDKHKSKKPQCHRILRFYDQRRAQFPNGLIVAVSLKQNPANLSAVKCPRVEFLCPSGRSQRFLSPPLAKEPIG